MRLLRISALFACVGASAALVYSGPAQTPSVRPNFKLPLSFEQQGEGADAIYLARGQGYMVAIHNAITTIGIVGQDRNQDAISLEFTGAKDTRGVASEQLPGKVNYFSGNDPKQWKMGLPTYGRVTYREVYPGIDVVYYGNQRQLEFDLVVKPGADPDSVLMKLGGARNISVDADGQLLVETSVGELRIPLPQIYQEIEGKKHSIAGHYTIREGNQVAFEVASYDRARPLVIDPTIVYGFLIGGSTNSTVGQAIAVDSGGDVYTAGFTFATNLPTTGGVAQSSNGGGGDGFVSKVNSSGTALLYSTYLGGSNFDSLQGIAVDSAGSAWVAGYTDSSNFPLKNQNQGYGGGYDAVVAKLSSSGALLFSSYLGGANTDLAYGVAVDSSNNAYVTGYTVGPFPTTAGVLQTTVAGSSDVFVTEFNLNGGMVYSTLMGGLSQDLGFAIAVDPSQNAYITGSTFSPTIPGAPAGGARTANAGRGDAFVAKLNAGGTALLYFTFLGGSFYDQGTAIALDSAQNAYVGGYTQSSDLNPTTGALQGNLLGGINGFVAKLNTAGTTFNYVTYLGGERQDYLEGLAYDSLSGGVYVTGYTDSSTFQQVAPVEAFASNSISTYQSANSGGAWAQYDRTVMGAVTGISADPVNSGTVVAATEAGIYRTTNNGTAWIQEILGPNFTISRSPVSGSTNTIYAMNEGQSYLSTDGGATWTSEASTQTGTTNVLADPLSSSTAYAFSYTGSSGVQKTTNGGQTWGVFVASGLPSAQVYGMAAGSNGYLYAAVNAAGVYRSVDGAADWTSISTGLPTFNATFTQYNSTLSVAPNNPAVVYIVIGGVVYVTTNATGATPTWGPTAGSVPGGATSISAQSSSVLYAASRGSAALYASTNGGSTWTPVSSGLGDSVIEAVAFDPLNSAHLFALAQVNYIAFVAKLNSNGNGLTYSTYLGSPTFSFGYAIATNGIGDAFVAGSTAAGFPKTTGALATTEAFVAEISDSVGAYTIITPLPESVLTSPSQTFSWSSASGADQYWLDVGSQLATGDYFGNALAGTSMTVSSLPCDGRTIYVQVWAHISGVWQGPNRYNYTAASGCSALVTPSDNSTFTGSTVTFSWSPSPGADLYWLDVGNSIAHGDIFGGALASLSNTVNNIPCDGRTIYVQLWTHLNGAWQNPGRYEDTAFTGSCGGGSGGITSPTAGSVLASPSQAFTWNPVSGADQYWLDVGTQVGVGDYYGAATTQTSVTVSSMPCDGRTLYVQWWVHINGNWQAPVRTTYTAASGCAALTSPVDGTVFTGFSQTFSWAAKAGADQYWLDVGNAQAVGDIFGGATTSLSVAVNNLPCDGRIIYVQLWTHISGAWKNPGRYRDTATNVCGALTTPAPGSTLSGSTVTFSWTAGAGVTAYWLDVGTVVGQGNIFGANVGTSLSQMVSGIPTTGQPIYVQLWSLISGVWHLNRYTYTSF